MIKRIQCNERNSYCENAKFAPWYQSKVHSTEYGRFAFGWVVCLHANAILWIKSLCGLKAWYPQVLDWIGFYYYYYCVVICVLILNSMGFRMCPFTKRASFAHFNNLLLSKYRKIFALGYCLSLSVSRNQQNRTSDF